MSVQTREATQLTQVIDRSKLYVLIAALETDLRTIVRQWILPYKHETDVFGGRYALLRARADQDGADESAPVLDYADFSDSFETINRHAPMVPSEIASAVKSFTPELSRFIGPRNRVMHSRPLQPDDLTDGLRLCLDLADRPLPLPTVRDLLARVREDPDWTPALDEAAGLETDVLHNLPLPEFDETGLLGRDTQEQELLDKLLQRREPILTVVGEGGMGKTALAVKVLYDLAERSECPYEAILWASLKTERLSGEGVQAVADAAQDLFGVAQQLGSAVDSTFDGTLADLADVLSGLEVLVVIDNVEATNTDEIVRFYDGMPATCQFLLTSRIGLGQLERRIPVGPLDPKSGAKMLRMLAQRRRLDHLGRLQPQQLEAQVKRLRGTPLAIRWFVEAVAAGADPQTAIQNQAELLRFCLETIYRGLGEAGRHCLSALYAARGPLDAPQLAVVTEIEPDTLAVALHDLQRRSLVEVQLTGPEGLHQRYRLTAATEQYLRSVDRPGGDVLKDVEYRLVELRESEEKREQLGETAVAPAYIDVYDESQKGVAHLLRKAIVSRKDADKRRYVEQAQALAPGYYEVHRVAGFVEAQSDNPEGARAAYERAYELAPTAAGRARVAFFFSWLLGNTLREIKRAIDLAQEAYDVLESPAAACRLAQCLMYARDFDRAEKLLRSVITSDDVRSVLIARTQLVSLAKRRVEQYRDQHQAIRAIALGTETLRDASAYISTGVTDPPLRSKVLELGLETFNAADEVPDLGEVAGELAEVAGYGIAHASELFMHPERRYWLRVAWRLAERRDCPQDLRETLSRLERTIEDKEGTENLTGRIFSFDFAKGYGFITTEHAEERVFFHRDDVADPATAVLLLRGVPATFTVRREERGLRAGEVRPDLTPEQEREHLRGRRGVVTNKLEQYGFARDRSTKAMVFLGTVAIRARDWARLAAGSSIEYDLELTPKGARAVRGTVTILNATE